MLEKDYQAGLIPRILHRIPGCQIVITDPIARQGSLDLKVIANNLVGFLEVKASERSKKRPNQQYYVDNPTQLDPAAVFAAFIYPENEVEVLNALQQALHP